MTPGILMLSTDSSLPSQSEYGLCTFTTMALSLPDWHSNTLYRQTVGTAHAQRLQHACDTLGYTFPWATTNAFIADLSSQLPKTVEGSLPWQRARIRLIPQASGVSCWLDSEPLAQGPDTVKPARHVYGLVLPRAHAAIKHPDYTAETAAIELLKPQGWDDIVRMSPEGALLEGSVSSVVLILSDGSCWSPDPHTNDCLKSLTLERLQSAFPDENWQLGTIRVDDLHRTPPIGAFLANAVRGIMPIERLSLASYSNGPEWTFDLEQTHARITRLAHALGPSGYHSGTGY